MKRTQRSTAILLFPFLVGLTPGLAGMGAIPIPGGYLSWVASRVAWVEYPKGGGVSGVLVRGGIKNCPDRVEPLVEQYVVLSSGSVSTNVIGSAAWGYRYSWRRKALGFTGTLLEREDIAVLPIRIDRPEYVFVPIVAGSVAPDEIAPEDWKPSRDRLYAVIGYPDGIGAPSRLKYASPTIRFIRPADSPTAPSPTELRFEGRDFGAFVGSPVFEMDPARFGSEPKTKGLRISGPTLLGTVREFRDGALRVTHAGLIQAAIQHYEDEIDASKCQSSGSSLSKPRSSAQ